MESYIDSKPTRAAARGIHRPARAIDAGGATAGRGGGDVRGMLVHADVIVTARPAACWSASPGRSRISTTALIFPTWRWTRTGSAGGSAAN